MDPSNSPGPKKQMDQQIEYELLELRTRILRLERALASHGITLEAPQIQSAPPPITESIPATFYSEVATPSSQRSLENRIGSQWFNRIGILAVLIGVAWFLKFAIDNQWTQWLGPGPRILLGVAASIALIAWSERFRRREYTVFALSLKAIGSGIFYLAIWAAFSVYHLLPASIAFTLMIAVTALNGFLSWIQNSELLALYAIVGGFSTPVLLSTGGDHQITLFSYLALLDLAVLILVIFRAWSRLLFLAFLGTVFFFAGWWIAYYTAVQSSTTAIFTTCFFLAFALSPRLIRIIASTNERISPWDNLAALVLPVFNAALAFFAFYRIFALHHGASAGATEAVLFAAFYFALRRLPPVGVLRESPHALNAIHLATAIVFLTIAIPLETQGRWLTIGWLVEGAALLWVASRVSSLLLRGLSILCLFLGLASLVVIDPQAAGTPLLNQRFAAYVVAIAVFAFAAWVSKAKQRTATQGQDVGQDKEALAWGTLAAAAILIVNLLALTALSLEIHSYWRQLRLHTPYGVNFHEYRIEAQFTYSALFTFYGGLLLALGFRRRSAYLRWQALILLAITIGKVFLVDVSQLSQGYRILSFLGMGALLLAISFVYQRDWLKLRGPDNLDANPESSHPVS